MKASELKPYDGMTIQNIKHPEWGEFWILGLTQAGVWEIRCSRGNRILFDNELDEWEIVKK